VGPAWIGDMVIAHSLFQLIQAKLGAPLDVLAPAWTHPLLSRMPDVDAAVAAPFEHGRLHLRRRFELARSLAPRRYARAFVLPNSWKSALVPFLAGVPKRTGFLGELRFGLINDARRLDAAAMPMMAQRYIALVQEPGEPPLPRAEIPAPRLEASPAALQSALESLDLTLDQPVLALCPGAEYGPAKQWPESHFAEVARHYLECGYAVWVMGSEKDLPIVREVDRLSGGRCRVLAGRTTLLEAIDLLSAAALVVSNDSGLMHIAAALNRPLVAVFGSTDPGHTPPLGRRAAIVRREDLPCSPCFQRKCPLGHLACLRELDADRVIEASARLLAA
jgi:heptosyltransferase-2